ncbi:uncharacterized protein LOC123870488 [Maniola jurtina]|uniref:uncharacterized protein LOC123870488 n=1 Tax=Maniola jurtina TaxID=191418 RepID=UPI001E687721|nr:uncharacterized protein LOC123870488 [Maniola jurtina]
MFNRKYLPNPLRCFAWNTPCLRALAENPADGYILRIPGLDTSKLDPFEVDYFKLDHDGLLFETKDTKIYGLKNLNIDEFSADANNSTLQVKLSTDVYVTGRYKSDGSLFYMPVNGEGDYWASLKNVVVDIFAPYNIVRDANGEEYIEANDNYKFSYEVKDNAEFRLDNLHYGFSGLSEAMQYLANANWKYISSKYVSDFIGNAVGNVAKSQFKSHFRLERAKFLGQDNIKNIEIDVLAPYNIVRNANGEEFIETNNNNYKFSFDVKDNAEFRLDNLHYGFSGLSEVMHYLVNANWKYIISNYAGAFIGNAAENVAKSQFKILSVPFKCLLSDGQCLKREAQAVLPQIFDGIPAIGLPPLEPMYIDFFRIDKDGVQINMTHLKVEGVKSLIIHDISVDNTNSFRIYFHMKNMSINGAYIANGSILSTCVDGEGVFEAKFKNIHVEALIPLEVVKTKSGVTFGEIKINDNNFKYEVKEKAEFNFSGLYDTDDIGLRKAVQEINDNWEYITSHLVGPLMNVVIHNIFKSIQMYMELEPLINLVNLN